MKSRNIQYQALYILILFFLFLFSAFRFEVGCDWSGYLNQFDVQGKSTFQYAMDKLEPLWWIIIHFVHQFDLPYPWLNVISSLIAFLGIHILARRQPDPMVFLILLYPILIINMPMSGIRQGAAIGVLCIAFTAFIDKKTILFIFWVLLASLIHSSAMIFFLLVPLIIKKYSRKRLFLTGLIALPGLYLMAGGDAGQQAQSRYVNTGYDAAGAIFRVGILVATSMFYIRVMKKKWKIIFPSDYKLVTIGSILMLAILPIIPISSIISDRLGYYLIPIQAIILARIPYLPIYKNRKLYIHSTYLCLALIFLIWTYNSKTFALCYIPYQSWLFSIGSLNNY